MFLSSVGELFVINEIKQLNWLEKEVDGMYYFIQ